ncbi:M2 family metallopeptidase [bacterium]|nr:M2 family metallopeptidase [bacterium]
MFGNPEAENALQDLLTKQDELLYPLRVKHAETTWQAQVSGSVADYKLAEETETELRLTLSNAEVFEELTKWLNDPGIQDIQLRRWATLMRIEMAPNRLPEEVITDLVQREKKIENIVNSFRPEIEGKTVTQNEISEILKTSNDIGLRRLAWEASKEIGPLVADDIRELVRARNLAARALGYPDFYRMSLELQEIDETRLFSSLGLFSDLSEDPYRRMKARLDRIMADHYDIEAVDIAPWHYQDPFFQEAPSMFGADVEQVFQGKDTLDWVKSYFRGMGLPIDAIFNRGDYYEKEGKHPSAFCLDVDQSGDVRVLLNLKDNAYWAGTALHEFGHAAYYLNISRNLPYTLRRTAHTAFSEASAMFFGRMTGNMEWLIEMFGLPGSVIRELEAPLKEERQVRMAVLSRWCLVMTHFERGLYRDPDYDQQARWWDLVERFQLVRRPGDRPETACDWATKIHIAMSPVYYHNYLLGEWIASQLQDQMASDLRLSEPVIFHEMPEVGNWLKEKVYQHGALYDLNELTRAITGTIPRPESFVKQFFTDY